jgi:hypothetical protein
MSLDIEGTLSAHDGCSFDLGTPRQYTAHGGWNVTCTCGAHICSHSDDCTCHRAHVAAVLRDQIDGALAEAWDEGAYAPRMVDGSEEPTVENPYRAAHLSDTERAES